jgi:hypothetical protein
MSRLRLTLAPRPCASAFTTEMPCEYWPSA